MASEPAAEQRCVDLWNSSTGSSSGAQWLQMFSRTGDFYGSVGFAEDYPDKCLYTFSNPNSDMAVQFIEADPELTPGGAPTSGPQTGAPGDLPDSVKQWNVQVNSSDGTLTLGRP